MTQPRTLELLAPARTADIGIEAIRHGADAVYIGGPQNSARQAAANSIDDIRRLADYAHDFDAKVYVTLNTILYDSELAQVERMIGALHEAGADALIVQDMAIRRMALPPIPLHASTQMHNMTAEKVRFLQREGFEQAVLARELSLDEIRQIHDACPDMRLEAFVHGALCVSLSGQCYASQALFQRSANRGACAQVCRMEFNLEDGAGNVYLRDKHLLSLRDLCQLDALEKMADAGVSSFKIEGRLKDAGYVKNVTAAYSQALDQLIGAQPERYRRASRGRSVHAFTPDVRKTFNRGFTHYFLFGRNPDIFSFDSPKAVGQPVGTVREVYTDSIVVSDDAPAFSNGDGLCFFDREGRFHGFRVNRAEGRRLYFGRQSDEPLRQLRRGLALFRNRDKAFDDVLEGKSAERFIPVDVHIEHADGVFRLYMSDGQTAVSTQQTYAAELARTHQHENIRLQLSKLGNTPQRLRDFSLGFTTNFFIPSSLLSAWRKELADAWLKELQRQRAERIRQARESVDAARSRAQGPVRAFESAGREGQLTYLANVANASARTFYADRGFASVAPAYELQQPAEAPVMFCRHCLRYAMGWCHKRQDMPLQTPPRELFLSLANGARFRLGFNCTDCLMLVYPA